MSARREKMRDGRYVYPARLTARREKKRSACRLLAEGNPPSVSHWSNALPETGDTFRLTVMDEETRERFTLTVPAHVVAGWARFVDDCRARQAQQVKP